VAANSVRELVAQAKAAPGKLNYSNPGNGTPQHLAAALFSIMAGADITHIVYKGAGPATADLVAGQTQVAFMTLAAVKQHIDAGKLKALAVATAQRSRTMPGLPTVAEAGLPGYQVNVESDEACCDLQRNSLGPLGMITPDYRFAGDFVERNKNAGVLKAMGLKP
jgi:tripartite-type tricarboxylate transporter receptor subunit TctC